MRLHCFDLFRWCKDPDCCAGDWHKVKTFKTERAATTAAEKLIGRKIYGWLKTDNELVLPDKSIKLVKELDFSNLRK